MYYFAIYQFSVHNSQLYILYSALLLLSIIRTATKKVEEIPKKISLIRRSLFVLSIAYRILSKVYGESILKARYRYGVRLMLKIN